MANFIRHGAHESIFKDILDYAFSYYDNSQNSRRSLDEYHVSLEFP